MSNIRTRFAVSPTGYMHVGGARNALFDWLVAKQNGGEFILRIEDTDQARHVAEAVEHIQSTLQTLGLKWDEGPGVGGPHGPYIQSERLDTYKVWAQKLIDKGRAYVDPYSAEEVQGFREQAQHDKRPFLYREHRPDSPDSGPQWDGSLALRFKSDPKPYQWRDEVMGDLSTGPEVIDDFILMKSDGYPTYNFAHIVDDAEMQVSHIIRGQEFLASIPNYLNLYEALELERPILATMPHILGPDGKKKLSKRDGAKDILDYVRDGYLPEALINFIASLGWNDGTEQEIFSLDELIKKFTLNQVQRSGARFDEQRLLWMNGAHIRLLPLDELYKRAEQYWPAEAKTYDEAYKKRVISLVQERLKYLAELPQLTNFFFKDLPVNPALISEHKQLKKCDISDLSQWLRLTKKSLDKSDFSVVDLTQRLNKLLEETGQKPVVLFSFIRIATTQAAASPGLADTLSVLGKDIALHRLHQQLDALS